MKPRDLMAVLLRVLGIWEFVNGCTTLTTFLQVWGQQGRVGIPWSRILWSMGAGVGVHFVASGILLWFAEPIATFFYPREVELPAGERTSSISLAERIATIPAADRLRFWVCAAGLLTLLYFGMVTRSQNWFALGTLHTLFLISIGCGAVAFLLRKTLPPVEGFLASWSVTFAAYTVAMALRLVP